VSSVQSEVFVANAEMIACESETGLNVCHVWLKISKLQQRFRKRKLHYSSEILEFYL